MDNAVLFNDIANNYRDIHTENIKFISGTDSIYFNEYKIKEIKDLFIPDCKFLDFGCGDGETANSIHKFIPFNVNYVGTDISEESINVAINKNINNCEFVWYNGKILPFENNTFDIVFVSGVFHHIDKKDRLNILKELNRVLKINGYLIIFEHNPINPLTRYIVKKCPFDKDIELISSFNMKRNIFDAGFSNIMCNFTIFMPRNKFFQNMLWLEKYLYKNPIGGQYYCIATK